MADQDIFDRRLRGYRYAKAVEDAAAYSPEGCPEGEEEERLTRERADALDALLLTPSPSFHALMEKLLIFNSEEIFAGYCRAREITAAIVFDAQRLVQEAGRA